MLEYTAAQFLDDRTNLVDGDPDEIFSDEFLVRQFNEAQRLLARRAWCIIEEGVAPAGVITLATSVAVYDLHKSVLRVLMVTPSDQAWPLGRTSDLKLRSPRPFSDTPFDINNLETTETGRPIAFSTDAGTRKMRVFRTPSSTQNGLLLNLKVARLPVNWLTMDDVDAEPEVPEEYHELLCRYAAGRALILPNVDSEFRTIGRDLISGFNDEVKEARQDRQRAELEPAQWGFSSTTAVLDSGYP